jgi:hypothetical protein
MWSWFNRFGCGCPKEESPWSTWLASHGHAKDQSAITSMSVYMCGCLMLLVPVTCWILVTWYFISPLVRFWVTWFLAFFWGVLSLFMSPIHSEKTTTICKSVYCYACMLVNHFKKKTWF